MRTPLAILLGLGASACWAIVNVAAVRSTRAVGTARTIAWAQLTGGAALAVLAALFDRREAPFTGATLGWLAAAGVAALAAYYCMFYAIEHGRLTIAIPITASWSVIASGLSIAVFHERVRPAELAGAALVMAGVVVVSRYAQREAAAARVAGARPRGPPGAAIGFGLLVPAMSHVAPAIGRLGATAAMYAADLVIGVPLALIARVSLAPPPRREWGPVLMVGAFETAGFACIALTAGRAPLAIVSPLASLASAITVAYAWIVLRDRPSRGALIGAALASAGVVILAL